MAYVPTGRPAKPDPAPSTAKRMTSGCNVVATWSHRCWAEGSSDVYGKLAGQILDTLPERSFDEKTPIDVELEKCLRAVTTLDGLLDALLLLERVVGARVGLEFTRYRWTNSSRTRRTGCR